MNRSFRFVNEFFFVLSIILIGINCSISRISHNVFCCAYNVPIHLILYRILNNTHYLNIDSGFNILYYVTFYKYTREYNTVAA